MIQRYENKDLTDDDWKKFDAVITWMADLFTAPSVDKEEFARISKRYWVDGYQGPRPFKLGVKLFRAYLICVYDLCLPKEAGLPKRFYPAAEKLLSRKHWLAKRAGRLIKWAAENRAVMEERARLSAAGLIPMNK